ncbi:neuropeptides capa receptor [Biomphalaria glabrata]|nr:neuropeptides capa receptor-like [Biomphalaria glabrata]
MKMSLEANVTLWTPDAKYFYYTRFSSPNATVKTLIYILTFVAIPAISLLGIVGNVLTACVLRRQGFKRSYNIFILALAVSDTIFLVGVNNVAKIIYDRTGRIGFYLSHSTSMTLYALHALCNGMEVDGKFMSMILPAFVSLERFIAVYFPLHLKSLVTCRRAKVAVAILFISWIPVNIYFLLLFRFEYILDPVNNKSVGYIMRSDLMLNRPDVYKTISGFFFMVSGPIPVIFVSILCMAVGAKIQIARKQTLFQIVTFPNCKPRMNLSRMESRTEVLQENNNLGNKTSTLQSGHVTLKPGHIKVDKKKNDSDFNILGLRGQGNRDKRNTRMSLISQTTIMLLVMCTFYAVVVTSCSLPAIILNRDTWESDTGAVVELCTQLAFCINSSANFVIYLTMNRNFRSHFKMLLSLNKDTSDNNVK